MAPIIAGSQWIKSHSNDIERTSDKNTSLAYNKYVFWESLDFRGNMEHSSRLQKGEHFKMITGIRPAVTQKQYEELKARRKSMGRPMIFHMTATTNLIVNIGSETVMETSIALHPYYGFPVIPASAIKGVARHYAEECLKPEGKITERFIEAYFGGLPGAGDPLKGKVVYFDAWPSTINTALTVDIINPHYQQYYGRGATLPADDGSPVPIPFLVVKKGTEFEFAIAMTRHSRLNPDRILPGVKELVQYALKTFGIGAKTDSSYGYFE